jgi:ABC-type glycerol-3-phosphate transport system permease component
MWNDYLVALIILGADPNTRAVTMKLAAIVATAAMIGTCLPPVHS